MRYLSTGSSEVCDLCVEAVVASIALMAAWMGSKEGGHSLHV